MSDASKQPPAEQASARLGDAVDWDALGSFDGPVQSFWEQFLQACGQSLRARRVLLLASGVGQPWQALAQWPAQAPELQGDADGILQLAASLTPEKPVLDAFPSGGQVLALRALQAPGGLAQVLAVVALHSVAFDYPASTLLAWADQVADIPAQYAQSMVRRASGRADTRSVPPLGERMNESHAERLYQILQLSIQLARQMRFLQMAYELCNALAARFHADRVSLGWMQPPYIKLTAISHIEKFDPLSTTSRALESAMEESADQPGCLVYPPPPDARQVYRANESYALMQGVAAVACVPLRDLDLIKGVLCLEKRQGTWSEEDLWELRLIAEMVVRPLADMHDRDRWWGARAWSVVRRWSRESLSPRHTVWKLTAGVAVLTLLVLIFLPWSYRVDATLVLRSKDLLFIPAPFDGYLRQVHVEIGDKVVAGQALVQLDTRDLVLEESMAEADVLRYSREAEKAQATRQLAEMQINLARQDQSASRLALVRHQLAHAKVTAPHTGVVVEGELKKNLGAALRKGDLLLKLAHTDDNYLELEIDQADVHEVRVGSLGEFALVGRPDQRFAIELVRIDPASTLRDGRNVYLARAKVQTDIPSWWRPGMGGTARIDAGKRPLIWVLTHRTVRFLREFFWL